MENLLLKIGILFWSLRYNFKAVFKWFIHLVFTIIKWVWLITFALLVIISFTAYMVQ